MNYNQIGSSYNQSRRADPYLAETLFQLVADAPDGPYLDLGCGTGNYTCQLVNLGLQMIGVDPSEQMLAQARKQSAQIIWKQGQAEAISLETGSVKGAIACLTIHHWENLHQGFAELYRVVGAGKLVVFTSFPTQMEGYWLNHYFPEMMRRSCLNMPAEEGVLAAAVAAGWELLQRKPYAVLPDLQDSFLYIGKYAPERYFDPVIRQGISSFRMAGLEQEVESGLSALRRDLDSGTFAQIQERYANEEGDYCWLVFRH